MTIKQQGGIFGRNPTFNDVDVDGTLNIDGSASFNSGVTIVNASRITGTDDAVPLLDLRANNTGGGTKNTLRFFDDDGSADNGQQAGRIEFYTDDNTNTGIHSYINSETNTTGYGTIKIGTGLAGSAVDRLTIASGGGVTVNTGNLVIGTSGQGIDFSATSGTGTSELLSDYEEGTWTPAYAPTTGSFTTMTYNNQEGYYTKIGDLVYINCLISTSNSNPTGGSGVLLISGLPYTCGASADHSLAVSAAVNWGGDYPLGAQVIESSSTIKFQYRTAVNGAASSLDVSDMATSTSSNRNYIRFSGCYKV